MMRISSIYFKPKHGSSAYCSRSMFGRGTSGSTGTSVRAKSRCSYGKSMNSRSMYSRSMYSRSRTINPLELRLDKNDFNNEKSTNSLIGDISVGVDIGAIDTKDASDLYTKITNQLIDMNLEVPLTLWVAWLHILSYSTARVVDETASPSMKQSVNSAYPLSKPSMNQYLIRSQTQIGTFKSLKTNYSKFNLGDNATQLFRLLRPIISRISLTAPSSTLDTGPHAYPIPIRSAELPQATAKICVINTSSAHLTSPSIVISPVKSFQGLFELLTKTTEERQWNTLINNLLLTRIKKSKPIWCALLEKYLLFNDTSLSKLSEILYQMAIVDGIDCTNLPYKYYSKQPDPPEFYEFLVQNLILVNNLPALHHTLLHILHSNLLLKPKTFGFSIKKLFSVHRNFEAFELIKLGTEIFIEHPTFLVPSKTSLRYHTPVQKIKITQSLFQNIVAGLSHAGFHKISRRLASDVGVYGLREFDSTNGVVMGLLKGGRLAEAEKEVERFEGVGGLLDSKVQYLFIAALMKGTQIQVRRAHAMSKNLLATRPTARLHTFLLHNDIVISDLDTPSKHLSHMMQRQTKPNTTFFNVWLTKVSREEAGRVFELMEVEPNLVTYSIMISHDLRHGFSELAKLWVSELNRRGFLLDRILLTTLTVWFLKNGRLGEAMGYFGVMVGWDFESWGRVEIIACQRIDREGSRRILQVMKEEGIDSSDVEALIEEVLGSFGNIKRDRKFVKSVGEHKKIGAFEEGKIMKVNTVRKKFVKQDGRTLAHGFAQATLDNNLPQKTHFYQTLRSIAPTPSDFYRLLISALCKRRLVGPAIEFMMKMRLECGVDFFAVRSIVGCQLALCDVGGSVPYFGTMIGYDFKSGKMEPIEERMIVSTSVAVTAVSFYLSTLTKIPSSSASLIFEILEVVSRRGWHPSAKNTVRLFDFLVRAGEIRALGLIGRLEPRIQGQAYRRGMVLIQRKAEAVIVDKEARRVVDELLETSEKADGQNLQLRVYWKCLEIMNGPYGPHIPIIEVVFGCLAIVQAQSGGVYLSPSLAKLVKRVSDKCGRLKRYEFMPTSKTCLLSGSFKGSMPLLERPTLIRSDVVEDCEVKEEMKIPVPATFASILSETLPLVGEAVRLFSGRKGNDNDEGKETFSGCYARIEEEERKRYRDHKGNLFKKERV